MKKLLFKLFTLTVLVTLATTFALFLFVLALTAPIEKNSQLEHGQNAAPTQIV